MLDTSSLHETARKVLSDEFISSQLIAKQLKLAASEIESLRELCNWLVGSGYNTKQHEHFILERNRLLTKGKLHD